jgi:hypothetical protein
VVEPARRIARSDWQALLSSVSHSGRLSISHLYVRQLTGCR